MSRPVEASAAKVKRRASVPKLGMRPGSPCGLLGDPLGEVGLHHAAGALLDQRLEADAVDQVDRVQHVAFDFDILSPCASRTRPWM